MKNGKKLLSIFIAGMIVVSMAACGSAKDEVAKEGNVSTGATTSVAEESTKGDLTVAGVVFQEDQFMKLLSLGYQDAAKAAGVKCLTGNTGNDQSKESELVNTYVAQKVDGIAIAPLNAQASVAVIEKADKAGVKIAVTNLDLKNAPFIVGGYTSEQSNLGQTTGKAAAKFIKEKLGGKAKIAVLQFKSQIPEASTGRVNGFLDEIKKVNPDVEVVSDQEAWLQDKAVSVGGDILTAHPDVNIIFGANDGATIGATMAVKNAGLSGKCFVFGIDTGDQQLTMLKDSDNILQAVTGQDPYAMGYDAMETLIKSLKGEDVSATLGKTVIVPGTLVSRDNPDGIASFESDLKTKMGK